MVNIPKSFQDFDDDDPDIQKRSHRWKYWSNLTLLVKEYSAEQGDNAKEELFEWIENKYGVRPLRTTDGFITDDYKVVDEQKFLVYILKYGK